MRKNAERPETPLRSPVAMFARRSPAAELSPHPRMLTPTPQKKAPAGEPAGRLWGTHQRRLIRGMKPASRCRWTVSCLARRGVDPDQLARFFPSTAERSGQRPHTGPWPRRRGSSGRSPPKSVGYQGLRSGAAQSRDLRAGDGLAADFNHAATERPPREPDFAGFPAVAALSSSAL